MQKGRDADLFGVYIKGWTQVMDLYCEVKCKSGDFP